MRCQTLPWHVSTDAYILPQKCDWHVAELRLAMPSGEENPRYEVDRGFHEKWHYSLWHEDFIWFHILFVSQLFWLLAVVCGTKEGFYCFYQGFWEVLSDLSGLVCRVSYAPWKVQLIKDKSVTYQMMLLRKKCSHHSKHVKVRIKMYLWSCQEEGCRMFVDYQPDRLWCSWFLVTSGVDLCCFIWTTLWFSPLTLKTSGEVV